MWSDRWGTTPALATHFWWSIWRVISCATKQAEGVSSDYTIYQFAELRQAVEFFERQ
jgi:hypothetical protein